MKNIFFVLIFQRGGVIGDENIFLICICKYILTKKVYFYLWIDINVAEGLVIKNIFIILSFQLFGGIGNEKYFSCFDFSTFWRDW